MKRLLLGLRALRWLGLQQVGLYGLYRLALRSGIYRWLERRWLEEAAHTSVWQVVLFPQPEPERLRTVLGKAGVQTLLREADEIVGGTVRLFGALPVALSLEPPSLAHWSDYETGRARLPETLTDIKLLWEPARFGWAFTLGRAYHLTGDERYAEAFWHFFETFDRANPPFRGPHWMNGQEVALRLMALAWSSQIFTLAEASTPERRARLTKALIKHAVRIPPTLLYARAQNNNHLLTEAAALFTAGLLLPGHPSATRWRALGWKWINQGLQAQIDSYGEYAQHSTNYHRLMLQVVLWVNALLKATHGTWPMETLKAVRRAVHWLLNMLDPVSGAVPNLGANDGAYIFPLTVCPFADFRPVAHAAARAFLNYDLPHGVWDEMALWFSAQTQGPGRVELTRYPGDQLYGRTSWAYLRIGQFFSSRPSHADQLHFDLWQNGINLTPDAGTYFYNAPPPWTNSLTAAAYHNTVTVNGQDQMTRAGRFLYLDWVNAYRLFLKPESPDELQRLQGYYRGHGYTHTRIVSLFEGERWRVRDEIVAPRSDSLLRARLHWLLPDWDWAIEYDQAGVILRLLSPNGPVKLRLAVEPAADVHQHLSLVRAGELLFGAAPADPCRGWISPTYGVKIPALSLALEIARRKTVIFESEFFLPTPT